MMSRSRPVDQGEMACKGQGGSKLAILRLLRPEGVEKCAHPDSCGSAHFPMTEVFK